MKNKRYLKLSIIIILIAILLIAVFILLSHTMKNSNILDEYRLTQQQYDNLKNLSSKCEEEIKNRNLSDAELYYSKIGEFVAIRGSADNSSNENSSNKLLPSVLTGNLIYIEVTEDSVNSYNSDDDFHGTTVNDYYGGGFSNAQNDINYNNFIYFANIDELLKITK